MTRFRPTRFWPLLLLAVPVVLFYAYYWRYAVNVPFQDDYDALFLSLAQLLDARSVGEYLNALTEQDDEHRIGLVRLVTRVVYALRGEVDIRWVGFVGLLSFLGLLIVFGQSLRRHSLGLWALLPVAFLLFQIQPYEGIFWGMIPAQNFAVLFLALLTLFCVVRGTAGFLTWACALGLVTTFTNSNGMVVFVPGLLALLYQRRWGNALIWTLVGGVCAFLYLHDLVIPAFRPNLSDNLRDYPGAVALNFFSFLGQFFDPGPHVSLKKRLVVVVPAGALLVGWSLYLLVPLAWTRLAGREPDEQHRRLVNRSGLFYLAALLYVLLTALVFAVGRAANGLEAPLASRYRLNVAVLLALTYLTGLLFFNPPQRRRWQAGFLLFSVLAWVGFYLHHWTDVENLRREKLLDAFAWRHTRTLPSSPIYLTPAIHRSLDSLFVSAQQRGFYRFPKTFYSDLEPSLLAPLPPNPPPAPLADTLTQTGDYLVGENRTFEAGPGRDDGAYLLLKSDRETPLRETPLRETHLFPTYPLRNGLCRVVTTGRLNAPGFRSFRVLKPSLSPGTYRVGWLVVRGEQKRFGYTAQTIRVEKSLKTALTLAD